MRTCVWGVFAVASLCLTAAACGGSESTDSATVVGPTPSPQSSPAPASSASLLNIAGDWSGRFGFEGTNNVKEFGEVTAVITQNGRQVAGTLLFSSPGWAGWKASFSGSLAGTIPDTQFVGTFDVQAPSATGTGVCVGQATFAGAATARAIHWEASTLPLTSNVPTQPSSACRGRVANAVSSLLR
jgi:hypothetical protein